MAKQLIRLPQVIKQTGLSRSMIYLLIKRGEFPPPIKLTERSVAWNSEGIDKWIDDRINQNEAA